MRREMGRVAASYMVTALCAMLSADTAFAQDALLVSGRFYSASRNFGQDLGPAPFVGQSDIFGGGRYGVVGYDVVDGRTGAVFPVFGNIVALDQARPRIFVRRESGVWAVDVASGAEIPMWLGDVTLVRHCALAYSADVLFCDVRRNDGLSDVMAIDTATSYARTIGTISLFQSEYSNDPVWIVTADGSRLYFGSDVSPTPGLDDVFLAGLDTTTGAITTSTASGLVAPDSDTNRVVIDEANERLIVISGTTITALSKDLLVLGTADIGLANLVISPHTGRIYLGQWQNQQGHGCCDSLTLSALDATTYASLASSAIAQQTASSARVMAVLTAPGAPKDPTATVVGKHVLVTWTNVGGASGFALDVGFAPGRTDLSVSLDADAHATFLDVPSGTYYLRLRGRNEYGGGRPSPEIKLVVP